MNIEFSSRWSNIAYITVKGNGEVDNYDGKFEGDAKIEIDVSRYIKDPTSNKYRVEIPERNINIMLEIAFDMNSFNKNNDDDLILKCIKDRLSHSEREVLIWSLIDGEDAYQYYVEELLVRWRNQIQNQNK